MFKIIRFSAWLLIVLIVDNHSEDNSWQLIQNQKRKYNFIKAIKLSRNFGHQGGLLAGLAHADGDAVICMDADLQHPPELIPQLLKKWEEGYSVVNTIKTRQQRTLLRKIIDRIFYRVISRILGSEVGHSDFRLIDRKALLAFNALPESEKFIRGLVNWVGFNNIAIPYEVANRAYGVSKYSQKHLRDLIFLGLTAFTIEPLRYVTKIGFITLAFSSLHLIYSVILYFLYLFNISTGDWMRPPHGWTTLAVALFFFGSIQLISLGIIGEYIGRIYNEVKKRPNFIIEEKLGI